MATDERIRWSVNVWDDVPCLCGHPGGWYHGRGWPVQIETPAAGTHCAGCSCREYRPQAVPIGAVMAEGDVLAALGLDGWDCDSGGGAA